MSIGIEHKLKGYLSRIEKIKADGTREVISADIEVPNTIVNLGRRMVSGEWLHKFAGEDFIDGINKEHVFSVGNMNCACPGIGYGYSPKDAIIIRVYNSNDLAMSQHSISAQSHIGFPGSVMCISEDGRDTSLDDTMKDYASSIISASNGKISEESLKYRPAQTGLNIAEASRVYVNSIWNETENSVDFLNRVTLRSVNVGKAATVRSILLCAVKENVTWPSFRFNNLNQPQLFSRIVLPQPIELDVNERLMITYDFHVIVDKTEALGVKNGINFSIRPFIRGAKAAYDVYNGYNSNYLLLGGALGGSTSSQGNVEGWVAPSDSTHAHNLGVCGYSFTKPPIFAVDDLFALLSTSTTNSVNSWGGSGTKLSSSHEVLENKYPQSGIFTSSVHDKRSISFNMNGSSSSSMYFYAHDKVTPNIPCNAQYRNIYFQNYPGCPETMMRGLDWQLNEDGKATFESCYAIQPTAGAMNIYGLLAHGAIVCFGKYDENGIWVDEPIVKSATQKAMISLKTIWNFD